jgi:hypothetical protein
MEPPSYYPLVYSLQYCWWRLIEWFLALASPLQSWGPCCRPPNQISHLISPTSTDPLLPFDLQSPPLCASSHHHFLPPAPPPATHTKPSTVRYYTSQRVGSGLIGAVGPWLVVTCVQLLSSMFKVLGSNRGTMPWGKMDERIALQQLRRSSGLMKEETWFHCCRRTTIAAATF